MLGGNKFNEGLLKLRLRVITKPKLGEYKPQDIVNGTKTFL